MRRLILQRLAGEERGIALLVTLGMLMVISISMTAAITYSTSNGRSSGLSKSDQVSYALAEAGVNNAIAVLANPNLNALDPAILTPSSGGVACPDGVGTCFTNSYDGGSVRWRGVLNGTTNVWTVTVWGIVGAAAAGGSQDYVRRLTVTVPILADPTQPANATAWNYVFATKTSNSTTCDVTVNNNAVVDMPFYVAGNLCLDNNAGVLEPDHAKPVTLTVLGKLKIASGGSSTYVGQTTSYITNANIGGGCTQSITSAGHVCTTADKFYVTNYSQAPQALIAPTPDWTAWYSAAKPGPAFPCTTASGTTPVWDNNGVLNLATNGSAGTFDLTPAASYSCKRVESGQTVGELSWNATTRVLTVTGVMYFDGSMSFSGTSTYQGSGTIYLSGSLTASGKLCAVLVSGACDFASWNPSSEMLIFVAQGSGNSATFVNGTHFQGGVQAKNNILLENNTIAEGPMIGHTLTISNNVTIKPMPQLTHLPLGAPGNPNTHASPVAPSYGG
jgi:Tfp pilus assembly protein PilX